ncbi:MAG: arylamine N-acetyltransferase [Planctomycetes bacterium]|nr:arylamine N-acetyltransferase [Planctomycetota bacterium]
MHALDDLLARLRAFPYENASKIVAARRRTPQEMLRDHKLQGAGGTCFDLVNLFHQTARNAGFEARLALADRTYGPNTHCAVIVGDTLCDPGYMQFQPLPLRDTPVELDTPYNRLRIEPHGRGWNVSTIENGRARFRYHLKDNRVGEDEFIDAWERSFEFEMMNHLVTVVARDDRLIYLRDGHYHEFSRAGCVRREVAPESARELGLSRELVGRALACLR